MEVLSMSTDAVSHPERFDSWRDAICKMVHHVRVEAPSEIDFSARLSARRHGEVGCASFWSKPHRVACGRESLANAGASGYLLSWQIAGEACVEQGGMQARLLPGSIAVVDGRRPMLVSFPHNVQRIVARLPAPVVERKLPFLARPQALTFRPQGPMSDLLLAYLRELSNEHSTLTDGDSDLVVENICNLLDITGRREGAVFADSKELRKEALVRLLRKEACDPGLSLAGVAARLNMSKRLVQKVLQDMSTNFTDYVAEERLQAAARSLAQMPKTAICEIAYLSGFTDVSHFNHLFKRRFGMPPSDWRHQRAAA